MKTIQRLARLFLVCLAVLGLWFGDMQSANAEDTEVPELPAITCEYNGQYFPNPADKHSFYQCTNAGNGEFRPLLHGCPVEDANTGVRMVFNPELNICDFSTRAPSS